MQSSSRNKQQARTEKKIAGVRDISPRRDTWLARKATYATRSFSRLITNDFYFSLAFAHRTRFPWATQAMLPHHGRPRHGRLLLCPPLASPLLHPHGRGPPRLSTMRARGDGGPEGNGSGVAGSVANVASASRTRCRLARSSKVGAKINEG